MSCHQSSVQVVLNIQIVLLLQQFPKKWELKVFWPGDLFIFLLNDSSDPSFLCLNLPPPSLPHLTPSLTALSDRAVCPSAFCDVLVGKAGDKLI